MRRLALLAVMVALASSSALASSAAATVVVRSTSSEGLVVEGKPAGSVDDVRLSLDRPDFGGEWDVFRACDLFHPCFDTRIEAGAGCRLEGSSAQCTRFNGKVTVNLGGGNDSFAIGGSGASQPITDPLVVNLSTGDDFASGGPGNDTINGGSGNDSLRGLDGNDVLSGSVGTDELAGENGNDTLAGGADPDTLSLGTGTDTADGGSGDDLIELMTVARDETDTVQGGLGSDTATYTSVVPAAGLLGRQSIVARLSPLRILEATLETLAGERNTTENDVLHSIETYGGGSGDDIITGVLSSNSDDYRGELGDDHIFGSNAANVLVGGGGHDELDGNGGADVIDAKSGEGAEPDADPVIDCGDGSGDLAKLGLTDDASPLGCETVERSPNKEGPHVRLPRVGGVTAGRAAFKLACPKALRGRCEGTLRLRLGGQTTNRTRYFIRRGRTGLVPIRLGRLQWVGGRRPAQLVSLERGRLGPKTTLRRVALRAR